MQTYDPGQLFMTFCNLPVDGFADGTFVTVERMTETFMSVAGAGGEVARSRSRDKRGSIKFTLLQSSKMNDRLSAIALADEVNGSGVGVFSMVDGNGTTIAIAPRAWIKKIAPVEFAKEVGPRDWEVECADLDIFVGGTNA